MPKISLKTRRPVNRLTLADFRAYPVWEYANDEETLSGRDETWVRPLNVSVVPRRSYTHVAAEFTTPCGKKYLGSVTVSTLDGTPEVCQGAIRHGRSWLFVSNPENFCFEESRRELIQSLGLSEKEMFPLEFRLQIPVAGHPEYHGGVLT